MAMAPHTANMADHECPYGHFIKKVESKDTHNELCSNFRIPLQSALSYFEGMHVPLPTMRQWQITTSRTVASCNLRYMLAYLRADNDRIPHIPFWINCEVADRPADEVQGWQRPFYFLQMAGNFTRFNCHSLRFSWSNVNE